MKLPADKIETLRNENVSIADKISLYNCNIWPKMDIVNDDDYAAKTRLQGNILYNSMRYEEAIFKYNHSLYQTSSIESRGLAYANRAAAYLGLALYQDCLDSVRLAKECPLPANVLKKVETRERMAIERLDTDTFDYDEPIELSYRRHKRISSFVYCLSPRNPRNPKDGIITDKNLLPGDILIVEPVVFMHGTSSECTNCLRKCGSLQPCKCSYMFCSPECKTEAFATYHRYECPLVEYLSLYALDELLELRVFFKLIQRFENVQSLRNYLENNTSLPNPFENDLEEPMPSNTPGIEWQHFYTRTAIVIDLLKNIKKIPLAANTPEEWSFLSELLCRLFTNNIWKLKPYSRKQIQYVRNSNREVGMNVQCITEGSVVIHGFASFIRSSLQYPNVLMDYVKGVLIVQAMKSISSGTELACMLY